MAQISQEAQAANCLRLLIEKRLEGPHLNTLTVFQMVSAGSSRALGMFKAMAYVDVYAEGDTMEFVETVGVNRSIPVNIFSTAGEAERWLLSKN